MNAGVIVDHFKEQAAFCVAYGSPFTAELCTRMGDDLAAGGPLAALVGDWPTDPRADALSLRLAGALHAAALTGRCAALAGLYPAARPAWRMDEVWPAARAFLAREAGWARDFIRSPPQTNETRRAMALLMGFLEFAANWAGPIDMLEIGASAGLNLYWDRFSYRTSQWEWGPPSPVVIDTDWSGPAPANASPLVRARAGCDLNPLDVADEAQRQRLKSYIWADQGDRLARFDGAAALALANGARVERADAAEWIARKLRARAGDGATIVYHSVFLQYPPASARAAIIEAIAAAGEAATKNAPLAWVRLEPAALVEGGAGPGPRFVIDMHVWPGGTRRVLGHTDGHVRAIEAI